MYNALTDRETLNKVLQQGLDDEEYQRNRGELVNLFMSIKDKIKIEDLTLYEPIFTLNIQKVKVPFAMNLPIFIAVTVVRSLAMCRSLETT